MKKLILISLIILTLSGCADSTAEPASSDNSSAATVSTSVSTTSDTKTSPAIEEPTEAAPDTKLDKLNEVSQHETIDRSNVDLSLMQHFCGVWEDENDLDNKYIFGEKDGDYTSLIGGPVFYGLFEDEKAYHLYFGQIQTNDALKYLIYKDNPDVLYRCYGCYNNEDGLEFIQRDDFICYRKIGEAEPYTLTGKITNFTVPALYAEYNLHPEYMYNLVLSYDGANYWFPDDGTLDIAEENRLVFTRLFEMENSGEQAWFTYELIKVSDWKWEVNSVVKCEKTD